MKRILAVLSVVACGLLMSTPAMADPTCDLTSAGASCTINGAFFQQINPQSTGTGVIDPFVRINPGGSPSNVNEEGFNTDDRPLNYDENSSPTFTHSLLLADVPIVTIDGVQYYQFLLDINETNSAGESLLSLDELQIFLGNAPDLNTSGPFSGFGADATLVFDLDGAGDASIGLDYALNHGSGSGDMFAYIPVAVFGDADPDTTYVYLYSLFGDQEGYDASDGFEEWAHLQAEPTTEVPEPGSLVLLGTGLMSLAGGLRKRLMS